MYYVYVLKSEKDKTLYIGYSANLRRRLEQHNSGKSRYTKSRLPWQLIYYEAYNSAKDAKNRELKLKTHSQTKELLITQIENSKL